MVQVEVMVDHSQHVFVVRKPSVLELPTVGSSIECQICRKKSTIVKVGVPARVEHDYTERPPIDKNQTSLLE